MKKIIGLLALGVLAVFVLLFIFAPIAAWIIIGTIILLIVVLLNLPIGADISFVDDSLRVSARADGFSFQIFPRKPKEPKPEEEKKPEEEPKPPKPRKPRKPIQLNLSFDEIMEILKRAIKGVGKFGKIRVRWFMLHLLVASSDPYSTAVAYNYINAGLSVLGPICTEKFSVKDTDVWTDISFTEDFPKLDTELSITIRLAQVFHMLFAIAFGVLGVIIKNRFRVLGEKIKNRGKNKEVENDEVIQIEDKTTDNIKAEERKDSNGE